METMGYSVKPLISSFKIALTLRGMSDTLFTLHSKPNLKKHRHIINVMTQLLLDWATKHSFDTLKT